MAMKAATASLPLKHGVDLLVSNGPALLNSLRPQKSHSDTELGLGLEWKRGELLFLSLISAALL